VADLDLLCTFVTHYLANVAGDGDDEHAHRRRDATSPKLAS
jgi:hypothetical protein